MATTVLRDNPRFAIASRTRNARFPSSEAQVVGRVEYCANAEDVARALQATLDAGLRPTVRSSGHCYEDFIVNNPNGAILDVSGLNDVTLGPAGARPFTLGPGTMLGQAYEQLFKFGGVTIPGGTCYTVTAGGHVSGGGYGTLCRLYGLTVDWLTAVDIVTVDRNGKAVPRRVNKQNDPHLFRALRGGQASNFGIVTAFHFDRLPPAPQEVVQAGISWDWADMTEDKFVNILQTYGKWMEGPGQKPESWGLFGGLYMSNKSNGRISVRAEYTVPEGPVKDLSVMNDLFDAFQPCRPVADKPAGAVSAPQGNGRQYGPPPPGDSVCYGERPMQRASWIEKTVGGQPGSGLISAEHGRAKYKSCYMKKSFTEAEARAYYRMMTSDATRGLLVAVDTYGGATNNLARVEDTAIPQRSSIMKLQYQSYWQKPEDDEYRLNGMRETYTAAYSTDAVAEKYKGTPFPNDRYEGCYINYPDADMLQHDFWPELYYGTGGLYPFLQTVKKEYDPHNIFHHAMSIQA